MGVPNTNTFNLRNVTDEFGLGDGDSLQNCFSASSSGDFDVSYNPNSDGTSNNLLNFRNYIPSTANLLTLSGSSGSEEAYAYAEVGNYSTTSQTLSYKCEYISYSNSSTVPPVFIDGISVTTGIVYTDSNASLATDNGKFFVPFTFGNAEPGTKLFFRFTLLSASVDTVPTGISASVLVTRTLTT